MKHLRNRLRAKVIAAATVFVCAPAFAAVTIWDGGGANVNWNTPANWAGDVVPPAGNDVEFASGFASGTTIELNGSRVANSILVNTSTSFAISGDIFGLHLLTLSSGNITRTGGTGTFTVDADVFLGQNGTWNPGVSTNSIILANSPIGQSAAGRSLTKVGAGRVVLASGGSYSGGTFINERALRMENSMAGTGPIVVADGAALEVSNLTGSNPISLSGGGFLEGFNAVGALRSISQPSTLNGPITLQTNSNIDADAPLTINGVISDGANSFALTFGGQLELRLNAANTYDGGTRVWSRVVAGHSAALGSGLVQVEFGGQLRLAENVNINRTLRFTGDDPSTLAGDSGANWSGPVQLAASSDAIISATTDFTVSGNITRDSSILSSGRLRTNGPGRVILAGNNSWINFTVAGGTLSLRSDAAAGGDITVNGGELEIASSINVPPRSLTLSGTGPSGQGALRAMVGSSTWGGNIQLNDDAPIFVAPGAQLTVIGLIGGASGLKKTGPGTLVLGGTGLYTGTTFVQTGTLSISNDSNLGPGPINVSGTLLFNTTTPTSRDISLNGGRLQAAAGTTVTLNGSTISGGFLMGPGNFASQAGASFNGVTALPGSTLTPLGPTFLNSHINGGNLTTDIPLTWNGGINTSSGKTTVNASTLTTTAFSNDGVITINSGGTLHNSGNTLTSGGGSRITINPGGALNVSDNSLDLNGALLVNNGTITGPTNVNFGSLAKGAGVFGAVNVTDGGRFSPGNSPGSVTTGSTTWNGGGHYLVEIADPLNASGRDFWHVQGQLILNASSENPFTISLASLDGLAFDPTRDYSWSILHASGGIAGFDPAEISLDISEFKNNLGSGHFLLSSTSTDLTLNFSAVPEPAALLTFLAAALITHRRRFRRHTTETKV